MRIDPDVAVVTGGARGIGAACALALGRVGAHVVVLDLDATAAEAVTEDLRGSGVQAVALKVDVTERQSVDSAIEEVVFRLGTPTILVNNAGLFDLRPTADIDEAALHRMMDTHVLGALNCVRAVTPGMVSTGYGRIVNVGSIGAEIGLLSHAHYAAAKAALGALSRSLARELGASGITCNTVLPGNIDTGNEVIHRRLAEDPAYYDSFISSLPISRLGRAEDVADAVAFLSSDRAGYIAGQSLRVDGGCVMACRGQRWGVGLVGAGWAAEKYLNAFTRLGVRVQKICTRTPAKAAALGARFGLREAGTTPELRELLEDDRIDIVVIASPSHLHAEQAVLAASHGKHLIIEKPVALTAADFDRVASQVSTAAVSTATGFVQRAGQYQQRVKQCIAEGLVGDPFYLDVGYVSDQPASAFQDRSWMRSREMAGDSFLLTGIHSVDTARWLASTERLSEVDIVEVRAVSARTRRETEYDDFASAQLRFANGALGTVASHLSGKGRLVPPVTVFGTTGTIRGDELWTERGDEALRGWLGLGMPHPTQEGHPALYAKHVGGFLQSLEDGTAHWSSVAATGNTHRVCFAITESLRTGQPVDVVAAREEPNRRAT